MFQGHVSLQVIRNDTVVNNIDLSNRVSYDLFNMVADLMTTGASFTASVQTMVAHFSDTPELPYDTLTGQSLGLGFKFNKPMSRFTQDGDAFFIQNLFVPIDEQRALAFPLRSFTLGRSFRSVSSDSISSQYSQYKLSNMANFGQVDQIYAYIKLANQLDLVDGDQLQLTWKLTFIITQPLYVNN